ncbi:unnamed protein product [Phytomonas sp. EM1]|nr:unnamed protein product [Phytomonas sp. EM1]|eukprot:CCW63161.1 unnamed protein product [Phytomonas sp. isolate EM1]
MNDIPREEIDLEFAIDQVSEARFYLIELDRRQNQIREAKRHLLKHKPDMEDVWMLCSGSTFVSCDLSHASSIKYLEWEQHEVEALIEEARDNLKRKVAALAELEGPDSALKHLHEGFDLKGMTKDGN